MTLSTIIVLVLLPLLISILLVLALRAEVRARAKRDRISAEELARQSIWRRSHPLSSQRNAALHNMALDARRARSRWPVPLVAVSTETCLSCGKVYSPQEWETIHSCRACGVMLSKSR
jgi:hypothetical protein